MSMANVNAILNTRASTVLKNLAHLTAMVMESVKAEFVIVKTGSTDFLVKSKVVKILAQVTANVLMLLAYVRKAS